MRDQGLPGRERASRARQCESSLLPALTAFFASSGRPATQFRLAALAAQGVNRDSELERRLGRLIATATSPPKEQP